MQLLGSGVRYRDLFLIPYQLGVQPLNIHKREGPRTRGCGQLLSETCETLCACLDDCLQMVILFDAAHVTPCAAGDHRSA